MARPAFKRWWTRYVPPSIERSTFVLAASLVLVLVVWLWQPMPATVWSVQAEWLRVVLWGIYLSGWVTVVGSTFWATPDMSQGRLLFAVLGTGYILVGVRFEEQDLRASLGEVYERYEAEVPRFVPNVRGRAGRRGRPPVDADASLAQDG